MLSPLRASVVAGLVALLAQFGSFPALAQGEQTSAEERLAAVDQGEAVEVMRAAIMHIEDTLDAGGRPLDKHDNYLGKGITVNAAAMLSDDFSAQARNELAERLADALGTEVGSPEQGDNSGVYVAASLPEVHGSEARVQVRRKTMYGRGFGLRKQRLKLERTPDGQWQVVETLSLMFIDGEELAPRADTDTASAIPFAVIEKKPKLVGGEQALYEALEYPSFAKRANIEGTVYIQFVVAPDGQARNFAVLRSPHDQLSKEAERVLREMRFEPGREKGEAVAVRMDIPIQFKQ